MGRKRKAESFLSCEEDVDDPSESVTSPGELIKYNIDTQTGYFKMDVLGPVAKEKQGRKKGLHNAVWSIYFPKCPQLKQSSLIPHISRKASFSQNMYISGLKSKYCKCALFKELLRSIFGR